MCLGVTLSMQKRDCRQGSCWSWEAVGLGSWYFSLIKSFKFFTNSVYCACVMHTCHRASEEISRQLRGAGSLSPPYVTQGR